jgi:hypothetical protein
MKFDKFGLPIISKEEEEELRKLNILVNPEFNDETGLIKYKWTEDDDKKFPKATYYFKAFYHPDMEMEFYFYVESLGLEYIEMDIDDESVALYMDFKHKKLNGEIN